MRKRAKKLHAHSGTFSSGTAAPNWTPATWTNRKQHFSCHSLRVVDVGIQRHCQLRLAKTHALIVRLKLLAHAHKLCAEAYHANRSTRFVHGLIESAAKLSPNRGWRGGSPLMLPPSLQHQMSFAVPVDLRLSHGHRCPNAPRVPSWHTLPSPKPSSFPASSTCHTVLVADAASLRPVSSVMQQHPLY